MLRRLEQARPGQVCAASVLKVYGLRIKTTLPIWPMGGNCGELCAEGLAFILTAS